MISIIIPTYNRLGKVHRAIDSVLRQSFKDFELIVVDDGSTDHTEYWTKKYNDARLQYQKISHGGVARARNHGARLARAAWLCFLDSDDVWHRHKLSEQVRFHAAHPEILVSQTDDIWLRNSMRVNKMKKHSVREGSIFTDSLERCLICCSSVMINKKIFFDVCGFDESLETCEDYDLWLRILCRYSVGLVRKKLVTKFGGHDDQLSKKFPVMDKYRIYALEKLLALDILTDAQRRQVHVQMGIKKSILEQGRVKRLILS